MLKNSFGRRWLIPIIYAVITVGLIVFTILSKTFNLEFGPMLLSAIISGCFCVFLFLVSILCFEENSLFIFYGAQVVVGIVVSFFIEYFTYLAISFLILDILLIFYYGFFATFPRRIFTLTIIKFILDAILAIGIAFFGVLASNIQIIIYIFEVLLVAVLIGCFQYRFITMFLLVIGLVINAIFMIPIISMSRVAFTNLSMIGFIFYVVYFGLLLFICIYDLKTKDEGKVAKSLKFSAKLLFSLIPLVGSFFFVKFEFDKTKTVNGIKYEIRNGEGFVADVKDTEFVEISSHKEGDIEFKFEDGCLKNLRSLKRLRISGTPFDTYTYKLFGTEPFENSYCVNGHYIPNSLKIVELIDTNNTVNTLNLLNSVDTIYLRSNYSLTLFKNPFTSANLKTIIFDGKKLTINRDDYSLLENVNIFTNGEIDFSLTTYPNMHVYNYDLSDAFIENDYIIANKQLFKAYGDEFDASSLDINTLIKGCFDGTSITLPDTIINAESGWAKNVTSPYIQGGQNPLYYLNQQIESNSFEYGINVIAPSLYRFSNVSQFKGSNNTVKSISEYAFADNHYVFEIPEFSHLTHIQKYAFSNCHGLDRFIFPDTLQFIGENAFEGTGLNEVFIPKGVKTIKKNAFINSKVEKIYLEADELPDTFEEGFDNFDKDGNKIEVVLGASRWGVINILYLRTLYSGFE